MPRQHRELSATEVQDRVKKIIDQGGALLRGRQNKTVRELVDQWKRGEPIRLGKSIYQKGLPTKPYVRPNASVFPSKSAASASKQPEEDLQRVDLPSCSVPSSSTSYPIMEATETASSTEHPDESPLDSRDSGYPYDALGSLTEPSPSAPSSPSTAIPPEASRPASTLLGWVSSRSKANEMSGDVARSQLFIPWSNQETVGCGTCPKYQADYVLGEITRKGSSSSFAGWIRVDYPMMSKSPDVTRYLLRDTYIFNPIVEFKELLGPKSLPCTGCGGTLTVQGLSSHGPRICIGLRKDFWVWPVTLVCTGPCANDLTDRRKRFLSLADEFFTAMPEEVLRSVPFVPSGPGGRLFSREVLASVRQTASGGNTLGHIAQQINANHVEDYLERRTRYTDHCTARRSSHGTVSHLQMFPPIERDPPVHRDTLQRLYLTDFRRREPYMHGAMSSLLGRVLKADHSYVVQLLHGAGASQHFSVMNEDSLIIAMGVCEGDGIEEYEQMLHGLAKRYQDSAAHLGVALDDVLPLYVYVDKDCCNGYLPSSKDGSPRHHVVTDPLGPNTPPTRTEQAWQKISPNIKLRLDAFHFMRRFELGITHVQHVLYPKFASDLRYAMFCRHEGDWRRLVDAASRHFKKQGLSRQQAIQRVTKEDVQKYCRRRIPLGDELFRRVREVIERYDNKEIDGVPLYNSYMPRIWKHLQVHIRRGCLSDPDPVEDGALPLYTLVGTEFYRGDPSCPLELYRTCGSTSQVEAYHRILKSNFRSAHCGIELGHALLCDCAYRYNCSRIAHAALQCQRIVKRPAEDMLPIPVMDVHSIAVLRAELVSLRY